MLDTLGARDLGFGDDVPYVESAWEQVERGERPSGDELAEAFFHLARVEERGGRARPPRALSRRSASCLDPLDPPLERLRAQLGLEPPRWRGARFAVALTHDVDTPVALDADRRPRRGRAAARATRCAGRGGPAAARGARRSPACRSTSCAAPIRTGASSGSCASSARAARRSTFFVMAGHRHPADGAAPEAYDRLRPRLVETLLAGGAEVGLHGSYIGRRGRRACSREEKARARGARRARCSGSATTTCASTRTRTSRRSPALGFRYDTRLGFADAPGFRARDRASVPAVGLRRPTARSTSSRSRSRRWT